jgi:hypothetical protein
VLVAALAFFFAPLLCQAQIAIEKQNRVVISNVKSPEIVGDLVIASAEESPVISKAVILVVRSDYKFIRVKAKKADVKFEPKQIDSTTFLFASPGKYSVAVTAFDPEKGIDDAEVEFAIDGTTPEPSGPDVPPGLFDNLAARVAVIARTMPASEVAKYKSTVEGLAAKMQAYEIKTFDQASKYLKAANLTSVAMNKLLQEDASRRSLSFGDAIVWYKEVARGLVQ